MFQTLARFARPLLLAAALLIVTGSMLILFDLRILGWVTYGVGHILAIIGFAAIAGVYRARMDGWAWLGFLVLSAGLILGVAAVATITIYNVAPCCGAQFYLPVDVLPTGLAAELITWVGLAFYGLAARGARALPRGIGWIFVAAAVVGVLAALRLISPLAWVLAVMLLAFGLLGVGVSLRAAARDQRATSSA